MPEPLQGLRGRSGPSSGTHPIGVGLSLCTPSVGLTERVSAGPLVQHEGLELREHCSCLSEVP